MVTRLTEGEVREVVEAATRAPSVLNTQPWRWHVEDTPDGTVLDLHADSARVLRVTDPVGRFLVLSCGAALLNARLALRHLGHEPVVRLSPDADEPRLLARIRVAPGSPASTEEAWLFDVIPERHTNRSPFHDRRLGSGVIRRLVDAAAAEGAVLSVLEGPQAHRVLEIADDAARAIEADRLRAGEVSAWVRARRSPDGIPAEALGPQPVSGGSAVRDFDPTHRIVRTEVGRFEKDPSVGVLSTYGDSRTDWVRGGQALQRVLLTATLDNVQASFRNEPLEVLAHRWRVRDAATGLGHPQMLMRLGYGEPVQPSPRRPLDEVLDRS